MYVCMCIMCMYICMHSFMCMTLCTCRPLSGVLLFLGSRVLDDKNSYLIEDDDGTLIPAARKWSNCENYKASSPPSCQFSTNFIICQSMLQGLDDYIVHECDDILFTLESVSLGVVLSFFSGADDIPPLGFPHEPVLNFSSHAVYPTASTCAIQLTLPTQYDSFDKFKNKLDQAFLMHGGFGLS